MSVLAAQVADRRPAGSRTAALLARTDKTYGDFTCSRSPT